MAYPFARNIKAIRKAHGMTQETLAAKLGVTRETIVRWENAKMARPRQDEVIGAIKELFDVTDDDLFGISEGFYFTVHGLDKPNILPGATAPKKPETAYAPLLGMVHAGSAETPLVLDDEVPVPKEVMDNHPNGYFLRVVGGCMNRVYPEGCYILIDPDMVPKDNSIAVVRIDGDEHVMRRLHRGYNTMILSPESWDGDWEDIIITDEHTVELVGVVVWFQCAEELD